MALEFQPPPAWLMQEYYNRKQPAEIASEGINNSLQTYAALKHQSQQQQLAQEDRDIKLAGLVGKGTDTIDAYNAIRKARGLPPVAFGGTEAPATPPIPPGEMTPMDAQGNPIMGPVQGPQLPGVAQGMAPPLPGGETRIPASGLGAKSPIIDHWNQTVAPMLGISGKPAIPAMGSDPAIAEYLQKGSLGYEKKHGEGSSVRVQRSLDIEKKLQDKTKGMQSYYDPSTGAKRFELGPNSHILPDSAQNLTFIGNDADGNPLFANKRGAITPGTVPGGGPVLPKTSTMPTTTTRASAEFADTILPHIQSMRDLVQQADQKGFIGPGAGRVYGQFLAGKVGSTGNPEADKLLGQLQATDSLLKTGALRVHFGARGGAQMYDHFSNLLNSGKQSAAMLNGSLDALQSFMEGYSQAGKPGAQRQQPAAPASGGWSYVGKK